MRSFLFCGKILSSLPQMEKWNQASTNLSSSLISISYHRRLNYLISDTLRYIAIMVSTSLPPPPLLFH